jgi:hypothetical protein
LELAASPYLVEFLSGVVPDEKNARCVTWAIHSFGNERYAPAVSALVKLLDFHRPPTEDEKLGVFLRPSLIGQMFPAAKSLEQSAQALKPKFCMQSVRTQCRDYRPLFPPFR